jgi:hypothetical protein
MRPPKTRIMYIENKSGSLNGPIIGSKKLSAPSNDFCGRTS